MSYRLTNAAKVANALSNTAYAAFELLGHVNGAMLSTDDGRKLATTRDDLMTYAAGAYVAKPPAAVLETLLWVQQMAQERASDADFNTAREALDEHDALRFVTDWLASYDLDVTPIRGAELSADARATLQAEADAADAALDALEAAKTSDDPGEVIREALAPFLGATSAETHADDVLEALDRAGFALTPKSPAPGADDLPESLAAFSSAGAGERLGYVPRKPR